jgi:hypothetical protein
MSTYSEAISAFREAATKAKDPAIHDLLVGLIRLTEAIKRDIAKVRAEMP